MQSFARLPSRLAKCQPLGFSGAAVRQRRFSSSQKPSSLMLGTSSPVVMDHSMPLSWSPSTEHVDPRDIALNAFFAQHRPLGIVRASASEIIEKDLETLGESDEAAAAMAYNFLYTPFQPPPAPVPQSQTSPKSQILKALREAPTGVLIRPQEFESLPVEAHGQKQGSLVHAMGAVNPEVLDQIRNTLFGDAVGQEEVEGLPKKMELTSVKRKRKLKMNKHKYKKRRKEQRALRKKLGK
ncbi:hypothetical protein SAICODRAFT_19571 [Saitoella complicata NRRL Y-17804]|uniref:uncharacterized protein n=1 Tax=Saitoella complicata (strain BCRC 22490 / CBS 7301 / JCM 7358 / NBRC 10748 / NRRL Y-17804) TaxID=698492 RepID=UPI0008679259|nr:uncharacterized protein SAICODRAFT_19571 [Saitoella complicata NRRL Y-17804]ODQ52781.1 hypothetical protein SAICODRAFT_19571 [Saitoella complicata NRRL Y-17804]